jgi:hypothetical protein
MNAADTIANHILRHRWNSEVGALQARDEILNTPCNRLVDILSICHPPYEAVAGLIRGVLQEDIGALPKKP